MLPRSREAYPAGQGRGASMRANPGHTSRGAVAAGRPGIAQHVLPAKVDGSAAGRGELGAGLTTTGSRSDTNDPIGTAETRVAG